MAQNGQNDHFGHNDPIPNQILAFARPKWTKMVHFFFGPCWPKEAILVHLGPPTVLWPLLKLFLAMITRALRNPARYNSSEICWHNVRLAIAQVDPWKHALKKQ